MEAENPPTPPPARFERCLLCPCDAGSCRLLTSTQKYRGRQFYKCPQCAFFKWADLVEPRELINVPYCGGCMAGFCRVTKVTSGPNAGRILLMCRVKEGQGSCGFRAWQDELHEDATSSISCDNIDPVIAGMVVDFNLISDVEPDNEPDLNDTSINMNIPCLDVTIGKMKQLKCQEDIYELLRTSSKESIAGDKTSFSPLLHPISESKEEISVSEGCHSQFTPECNFDAGFSPLSHPISESKEEISVSEGYSNSQFTPECNFDAGLSPLLHPFSELKEEISVSEGYSHSQFTPECNYEPACSRTTQVASNAPSCAELFSETTPNNIMTEAISKSFALAAEHLQNDLITRLEVMDFKDHEAMTHASEATFAALNRLFHDYQPLKERVNNFIQSAVSLADVENSILDEDSYQCLMDHCQRERKKVDEIDKVHVKVVGTVDKNGKRLIVLQKELSLMKEWISRAEAEIMCCKAELGNMVNQLVEISNKKQILKENFLIASTEWEDRLKLQERKDVEKSAAKAAFNRARALLRR